MRSAKMNATPTTSSRRSIVGSATVELAASAHAPRERSFLPHDVRSSSACRSSVTPTC